MSQPSRENPGHLPLPGEGAVARAAAADDAGRPARPCPPTGMYAIENGPSGFDPAAARLSSQAALPDADAERAAGRAAHRVRRGEPHADHPLGKPRGRARRPADAGGPRRDRAFLRGVLRRRTARAAEGAARARATASPTWPGRWSRSSTSPRSRRWRTRPARRSTRSASAAISMSRAGRPGTSSICSTRRSPSDRARG